MIPVHIALLERDYFSLRWELQNYYKCLILQTFWGFGICKIIQNWLHHQMLFSFQFFSICLPAVSLWSNTNIAWYAHWRAPIRPKTGYPKRTPATLGHENRTRRETSVFRFRHWTRGIAMQRSVSSTYEPLYTISSTLLFQSPSSAIYGRMGQYAGRS